MMQMIKRPTSAKVTTSVRRMTGGSSPLLSGRGVPSFPLAGGRSLGKGFVGGGLVTKGLADKGLVGMTLTMAFPRLRRQSCGSELANLTGIITWRRQAGSIAE